MSPEAHPALMLLGSLEASSVQAGFGREVSLLLMLYREEVFFFFLTQAQASYGAGSWPHHRMLWGVNLGDAALWKDMFSSQDSSAYSEQCLYWG